MHVYNKYAVKTTIALSSLRHESLHGVRSKVYKNMEASSLKAIPNIRIQGRYGRDVGT